MKKKLVIDARMINDSGIGTYLKNIIPFLIPNFIVVLLGNKKELEIFENISVIPFYANIYSIKEQLLLPFIIPKCYIFWSPHINSPIFPIKANKRVTTIHDVNHIAFKGDLSYYKKLYAKLLYLNSLNKSNNQTNHCN